MYLTYEEYQRMGGGVDAALYPRLEFAARRKIDYYTQGRVGKLPQIPEDVKMVLLDLIELAAEHAGGPVVQSESNAGVSVTYQILDEQERAARAEETIRLGLPAELLKLGVRK